MAPGSRHANQEANSIGYQNVHLLDLSAIKTKVAEAAEVSGIILFTPARSILLLAFPNHSSISLGTRSSKSLPVDSFKRCYPTWPCKRNIERTPLCQIEVTHPRVLGFLLAAVERAGS